jgi:hypothetical protein
LKSTPDSDGRLTFSFKARGGLKDQIHDMKFFIACYDNRGFSIGKCNIPFNEVDIVNLDEFRETYKTLCELSDVLNLLGVSNDLDVDAMNNQDKELAAKADCCVC